VPELSAQIDDAAAVVASRWPDTPRAGLILGTGLSEMASHIESRITLPYDALPHFPQATAMSHEGQLSCGMLSGVPVIAMEGRFHLYEGYTARQITLPVRVMKALGADLLIVSNASGGVHPGYKQGDIVVIDDHINLLGDNPLFGINDDSLGPRFPDMSAPYDRGLIEQALEISRRENFVAHRGVYAAMTGPNYETRAEYRFLRRIGADVVGMSTVPEVIAAIHTGLSVLALSTVANMCLPDAPATTQGEDVVKVARMAEPKLRAIVMGVLAQETT